MEVGNLVKDIHGLAYEIVKIFPDGHFDIKHTEAPIKDLSELKPTLYSECMQEYKLIN